MAWGQRDVPERTFARLVHGSAWERVLPATYQRAGRGGPDVALQAALVYAGPDAMLTGVVACRRYRLHYVPDIGDIAVLVPHTTRRREVGPLRLLRTTRLPRPLWEEPTGLPLAPPERALGDAARGLRDLRTVRALVLDAVARELVSVEQLWHELTEGPRRGSHLLRRALSDANAGVRSAPEADLRDLALSQRELRGMRFNVRLHRRSSGRFLAVVDGWLGDAGVAIEVDSVEYHAGAQALERTLRRHNALAAAGVRALHLPPRRLRRDRAAVLCEILSARATGLASPQPDVVEALGAGARP